MATDPVCGMYVDEKTAPHRSAYKGQIFYFCASSCKEEFEKNPENYLK